MNLKKMREEKGLTQQRLADELGMIQFEISLIETGRRKIELMQVRTAKKIADYFGIKIEELLKGDD